MTTRTVRRALTIALDGAAAILLAGSAACGGADADETIAVERGPAVPSWIEAAPGGRYFVTEDGRPFVPIGNQPGTGFLDLPDADIDAHFARMEAFGETVARLDFDYFKPHSPPRYLGLESSVGVYDEARIGRIDTAFKLAAAHGVRILVVPWLTSPPLWESWPLNPYSTAQGGPANDPYAFLTSAAARATFGARLEWISARWGASGSFFAWDLMNESDVLLRWDDPIDDPASLESWVADLGSRTARFEAVHHGRAHPRMVSWSTMLPSPDLSFLFDSTALDVASTHPYEFYGTNVMDGMGMRTSVVEPALAVNSRMRSILASRITDRRPYLENERHFNTGTPLAFHREADHAMAWSELASGAAGTGITWLIPMDPWKGEHESVDWTERHRNLGPDRRALRDFVDQRVPPEFFLSDATDESLDALATGDRSAAVMSVRRGPYAIGWVVGLDERCILVESVDELRAGLGLTAGEKTGLLEAAFSVLVWGKLLRGEGVPLDESVFEDLIAAVKIRDPQAFEQALPDVVAYLEGLEAQYGTLASLAECPDLAPPIRFEMPAGDYRVDWIDDTDASVLRTDTLAGGAGTLKPPTFERHLAVVVAPRQDS